jgi:membrane fusion protein (multidrug efflux system)
MPSKLPKRGRSTISRAFGLFAERLEGRSTAIAALLVLLVFAAVVVAVRQGTDVSWATGKQSTDDAYVRADQIAISSHIAGYIASIPVEDNQWVRRGQLVAQIEDDDYIARVADAEADLAAATATVDVLLGEALVQKQKVVGARAVFEQANLQFIRQKNLIGDGTTSQRELEAAQAANDAASADLNGNIQALQVIDDQIVAAKDEVQAKTAIRDLAEIDLGYTRIISPADGQLSARIALTGEYVMPGTQIGLLVPLPNVWIVANFREAQLAHMWPGQVAFISVDSVPGRVFRGKVDSIGPASGALQALLPPDNATGNFTKVAQRFAVKILIDPHQSDSDRLRPGMSAIVTVATAGGAQASDGTE